MENKDKRDKANGSSVVIGAIGGLVGIAIGRMALGIMLEASSDSLEGLPTADIASLAVSYIPFLIGGGIAGFVCGLAPYFIGKKKNNKKLGKIALFSCIASGLALGVVLALPVAIILSIVVAIKARQVQVLNSTNSNSCKRTRTENAEFVIEHIRALGLSLNPESRFMKMYSAMTNSAELIRPDDPEFETALEAERDFQVLAFVFEQTDMHTTDAEFKSLVKKTLNDSLLPQEDRNRSKGRDAQFELFVAAICQKAGMLPVSREEPDVTCHVGDIKFSIAAKRIKNVTKLERHIRKAANQIKKAGFPGIIALDTCVALNPNNERVVTSMSEEQFGPFYSKAIKRFIDNYHDNFQYWVCGKGVRGIVIHDQQVVFQPNDEWSLVGMTKSVDLTSKNNRRKQDFDMFRKQYETGLPNVTHL